MHSSGAGLAEPDPDASYVADAIAARQVSARRMQSSALGDFRAEQPVGSPFRA